LLGDPARYLDDDDEAVRRLAVAVCTRRIDEPGVHARLVEMLGADPSPRVRAEAAEALGTSVAAFDPLLRAGHDLDPLVREAAATALGELAEPAAVPWLTAAAEHDPDRLVREAAVAALGAVGDPASIPVLLRLAAHGPPQIRRRAVVALTVFEGPEIEPALRAAARDRNPMVREVAEMVVGRPAEWEDVDIGEAPRSGD
jgi:HEAT repeat protein